MTKTRKSIFKDSKQPKEAVDHHHTHKHHESNQEQMQVHNDINITINPPAPSDNDDAVKGCFKAIFGCIK